MRLVFLHGFATTPEIWEELWKPANKLRGFQNEIICEKTAPIYRGRFPNLIFDDIDREVERISESLKEINDVILIGWSMGGMVAQKVAAQVPGKLKALVLISTTPKFLQSPDFPAGISPILLRRLEKRIAKEGTKAFHDLIFKAGQGIGLAQLPAEQAKIELAELTRVDLRGELAQIRCPTLIIHGERDEICLPAAAEYLHDRIKGSALIMLAGVGHAPMVEAPGRFNEALCWINNL